MAWQTFTAAQLSAALTAQEAQALATYLLRPGESDPTPEIASETASEIRGYVAAHYGAAVGQPGEVPEELVATAKAIGRWYLLTKIAAGSAAKVLLTDARKMEYEAGIKRLESVASGKFAVSVPIVVNTDQPRPQGGGAFGKLNIGGTTPETFNF